jgi:ATP-dependent Lon protease
VWLATANDPSRIPEPLLDRLTVYEIEAPDADGSRAIALNIYRDIRDAHDWGKRFPEMPEGPALEKLAALPPREMRRALQSAFGTAKLAGRDALSADDIQDGRSRKQRIGF